jgi:cytochrome c-type biogenesis protein CcmH
MIANKFRIFLAAAALVFACQAAAKEPLIFMNPEQEARYNQLTLELRCLVCQNQNLADSDAPLAQDLRREIFDMMQAGRSNDEIKTFLVDRYGDFVLYKPPIQGNTVALWLMPAVLLMLGGVVVILTVRKRTRMLAEHNKESQ